MILIPKSKLSRKVAPDAARLSHITPKSYSKIKEEQGDYLPLAGGTLTGAVTAQSTVAVTGALSTQSNLTVTGNTDLGNADTDTIGFYGVTKTARQNHIADPSGGATIDAEARTAINAILVRIETIGINKTS